MTTETEIKQQVRDFYDQVGWQEVSQGIFQNARYEDLRPVASEYIHKCHLRVSRHLQSEGKFLLDAGSGPIQYPEYLTYSAGYDYRVCADISIQALREARKRIGDHGLFVVSDVANLPFKREVFDGVVSLHTIHHLPVDEHLQAYQELQRVLESGSTAVIVNGWGYPPMAMILSTSIRWMKTLRTFLRKLLGRDTGKNRTKKRNFDKKNSTGTFVRKTSAKWLQAEIGDQIPLDIYTWRSISAKVSRFYIHSNWFGEKILAGLYSLEESFPAFFGRNGYYPLIVMRKP
jgi:ubiquinone/menaquinone biosynthesis C-methylase UbiE